MNELAQLSKTLDVVGQAFKAMIILTAGLVSDASDRLDSADLRPKRHA